MRQRVTVKIYEGYQDYVSCYLEPGLGNIALSKIEPMQIQLFYNSMLDKGLSPRTVRYAHSILRSALNQAVKWGLIHRNPAPLVDLPKNIKSEMNVFTPTDAAKFIDAIAENPWKTLFSLLIATGMRPGEALGLKWQDIDFEKGRVHVQRALSKTKSEWNLLEPKTPQSKRSIPLPRSIVKNLEEHKAKQAAEKLLAENYIDNSLVLAGKNGAPPDYRNIYERHFKTVLKDTGLPEIRLYDLRHTCATLLLSAGENPKVVSERLGHSSVTMTLDTYTHVLPDMQDQATTKLEEMLYGKKSSAIRTIGTQEVKERVG